MNTIKINGETNKYIEKYAKETGYSKVKIVEIVFRGLTDKLIDTILFKNHEILRKRKSFEAYHKKEEQEIEETDDNGEEIEWIEEDEIDWDEDDEYEEEEEEEEETNEERQARWDRERVIKNKKKEDFFHTPEGKAVKYEIEQRLAEQSK